MNSQNQKLSPQSTQRNAEENLKQEYNSCLSTDYERLFALIREGVEVPAFVDYSFSDDDKPIRDITAIKRYRPYQIQIGVRGLCYGAVYPFDESFDEIKGSELSLFVRQCERLNLEFFDFTLRNSAYSAVQGFRG